MIGEVSAADADGMDLRNIFSGSHDGRYGSERPAHIIHIEARHYHARSRGSEPVAYFYQAVIEKLGFIDPHYIRT